MANCIFVETGQCGNQLGYSLLDSIYSHLKQGDSSGDHDYLDTYFRSSPLNYHKPTARVVCLDTEPKVINECLQRANTRGQWGIDPRSVAYRHGGAGNNWALGYEMASGEFLQTSIDLIRRELEYCDYSQTLVFMHSVAGGTGSGLGTKLSESCQDEFHHATRLNIAVAPYHFGEVVVQHYNAVLCLSKISAASHGVLIFENEIASMLCKTMKGIERPSLAQLNQTIVSNICPMFLPKYSASSSSSGGTRSGRYSLLDDITHLCAHPGYPFLDVKVTPQTSNQSVDFTCDNWNTLLKTIQQMQLSGSASERGIKGHLKHALQVADSTGPPSKQRGMASPVSPVSNILHSMNQKAYIGINNGEMANSSPHSPTAHSAAGTTSSVRNAHSYASPLGRSTYTAESRESTSVFGQQSSADNVVRSLASVVTLHGAEAATQAAQLQRNYDHSYGDYATDPRESSATKIPARGTPLSGEKSSGSGKRVSAAQILQQQQLQAELQLHELYVHSHSPLLSACGGGRYPTSAVKICASEVPLNGYQRATSALANSQSILPLLQRAARGGAELYEAGAYLHQYSMYGIEEEDFQHAFRSLGSTVQNYMQL